MNDEITLDLPKNLFKNNVSFTMDFGGSALKIIYTTAEGDVVRLHFVTYSREQHEEAFRMLVEKIGNKLEAGSEVFTCGVGASEYHAKLQQLFDIKVTNTNELDRLMEGFHFMAKNLTWSDFVHPQSPSARRFGLGAAESWALFLQNPESMGYSECFKMRELVEHRTRSAAGEKDPEPDQGVHFPVIVCLVGSAGCCFKVEADGSCRMLNLLPVAGRAFLGLSSLLTDGNKSFKDICEMLDRGEPSKVDAYAESFDTNKDDPMYGIVHQMKTNFNAFSFGHAVAKQKDDFKQEDMACALVSLIVDPLVVITYNWAMHFNIKQVFFVGGFACNNDYIRQEFAKQFEYRKCLDPEDHSCDCHFLKLGQHCGSVGTIIKNLGLHTDVEDKQS